MVLPAMALPPHHYDGPDARAAHPRFRRLQGDFSDQEWSWLAAIASEHILGASVLAQLGLPRKTLEQWSQQGVLEGRGTTRPLSFRHGTSEQAYGVPRAVRQDVLRRSQAKGLLGPATLRSEEILGARSRAGLVRALSCGSLILRPDRAIDAATLDELCASLLEPFDAEWFERTWNDRAPAVACVVLRACWDRLRACDDLRAWAERNPAAKSDRNLRAELVCHAIGRGEDPGELQSGLPEPTRTTLRAVQSFVAGFEAPARRTLTHAWAAIDAKTPPLHALTPLLALLGFLWGEEAAPTSKPQFWFRGTTSAKETQRALVTFVRHQNEPEESLRRIDVHQLRADASIWQLLIGGLTAHRFVDNSGSRAGWCERLASAGCTALVAGYPWLGRQALVLAAALDREHLERVLDKDRGTVAWPIPLEGLAPRAGDLAGLVRKQAAWEAGLTALARLSTQADAPQSKHQLSWFIDPSRGLIHRPGLMIFEPGRGWFLDRRLSWQQARALVSDLGEDDRRPLLLTELSQDDQAFPHLEIFAALVDHPRVIDGTRGGLWLTVRREQCRIETFDEPEFLRVGLRPSGVGPGLNLHFDGDRTLHIIEVTGAMQAALEALPQDLLVPHQDAKQALSILAELGEGLPIRSGHLDGESESRADDTPCLRVTPISGAYLVELGVQPFGEAGRFFFAAHGPALLTATRGSRKMRAVRDFEAEVRRCAQVIEATSLHTTAHAEGEHPDGSWFLGQEELLVLLGELRDAAERTGLHCSLSWPDRAPLRLAGSACMAGLRGALRSDKGWYLLSGSIAIDQVTSISLAQLARAPFSHGGRYLRLPSGAYVALEGRVRRLAAVLSSAVMDRSGNAKLSEAQLLGVRAVLEGGTWEIEDAVQAKWQSLGPKDRAQCLKHPLLEAELRPYQKAGVDWLCGLSDWGFGACLADDMGLGKTVQIIAFLLSRPIGSRHLVVAPLSVCTNWEREIARFAPTLSVRQYQHFIDVLPSPPQGRSEVWITSYQRLANALSSLGTVPWDVVVADEAQFIKNPKTQRARALIALSAQRRIAATGTPIENHLGDLWGIFRFLQPDLLGRWSAFSTHFAKPIERDKDSDRHELLKQVVAPFVLRRTKSAVLKELPPRSIVRREVHLNEDEALRYALLRRQLHDKLRTPSGRANNKLEVLAEITRLRRFCCHPRLVFPDAPNDSPKLRGLIPLLEELTENGHRALVFSQYVDFLSLVRERLAEQGIEYEYLDGRSSAIERQTSIDNFSQNNVPVFVLSLKAGGLGINLTAADYVIHLDPWWNPAVSAQATDRAHRLGQRRPVTVYEFITAQTIEEDILRLHESKTALSKQLLENADQVGELPLEALVSWLEQSLQARSMSGLSTLQSVEEC